MEWVAYFLILATVFVTFHFILMLGRIPSESMEPTLMVHDWTLGNRLAYNGDGKPERGDIIIFDQEEEGTLIKRVIGLPGETVSFVAGKVYIDDATTGNQTVIDVGAHIVLCRWKIIHLRVDFGILTEKVIAYIRFQEVHIRTEIIIYRCNITPVFFHLIAIYFLDISVADQYIRYKVKPVLLSRPFQNLDQLSAPDNVNTGRNGVGSSHQRFLFKLCDTGIFILL